jgi:AraC-like DNA-binding protein
MDSAASKSRPAMSDVAADAGVSVKTVSRGSQKTTGRCSASSFPRH